MPNMSYCQFENVYNDLLQLIHRHSDNEIQFDDMNDSEKRYAKRLLDLCNDFVKDVGPDIENMKDE